MNFTAGRGGARKKLPLPGKKLTLDMAAGPGMRTRSSKKREEVPEENASGKASAGKKPAGKKLPGKKTTFDATGSSKMVTRSLKKREEIIGTSGKEIPGKYSAEKNLPGNKTSSDGVGLRIMTRFSKKREEIGESSEKNKFGKASAGKKPAGKKLPGKKTISGETGSPKIMTRVIRKREVVPDSSGKKASGESSTGKKVHEMTLTVDGAAIPSMMTRSIQKQREISTGKTLSGKNLTGKKWKEEEDRFGNGSKRKREEANVEKNERKGMLKMEAGRLSASKDHLLGNSEEVKRRKEPEIEIKAVRKRREQVLGIDGIKRFEKIFKIGPGKYLEQNKGDPSSMAAKGREGQ